MTAGDVGLPHRHAAVIGIDAYSGGLAPLRTATADARAVAAALGQDHGYRDPITLLDAGAGRDDVLHLLETTLPEVVEPESALVLYFAGHGVAMDGDDGPQGYLMPWDSDAARPESWLAMRDLRRALEALTCRHLLVVLDCCFAGSFRWSATRASRLPALRPLYDSQYARYLEGDAWQVLTSASHQEEARDVAPGSPTASLALDRDEEGNGHSPFAAAFLRGLAGGADSSRGGFATDGVITATELYQYIFQDLVPVGETRLQTPGLWPLKPATTGQFIFASPERERATRPDPPLDDANNPWLGLAAYGDDDSALFFGRERVIEALEAQLADDQGSPLIALAGASGTGKSSVVKAGLLPRLHNSQRSGDWTVVACDRLGADPEQQLSAALEQLDTAPEDHRRLLVIDQFEELYTQCGDAAAREAFLVRLAALLEPEERTRVLITLRSDFDARIKSSQAMAAHFAGRLLVPAFSSRELRDVIEGPAEVKALYFDPPELVGTLIDEVPAIPGGLPLLSFALAETYRQANQRRLDSGTLDRALTRGDYEEAGGVVGALHRRATKLYEGPDPERPRDPAEQELIRRIFLRMVSLEGGALARRRVSRRELDFSDAAEDQVDRILEDYVGARLLVASGSTGTGAGVEYLEPAHDSLVVAWEKLTVWRSEASSLELQRQVWRAAADWHRGGRRPGFLWRSDPRLPQARAIREELNRLERDFVDASTRQRQRRRSLRLAAVATFVIGLAVAAVLANAGRLRALRAEQRAAEEAAAAGQVSDFLTGLFEISDPSEARGNQVTAREILDQGAEEIRDSLADQPVLQARMMVTIGEVYQNLGLFDDAGLLLEDALSLRREALGEAHPDVADSLLSLGVLRRTESDPAAAEALLRRALEIHEKVHGPEHPAVADSLHQLAVVRGHLGQYQEAEALFRRSLAIREHAFGPHSNQAATSLNSLGIIFFEQGDYASTLPLFERALEIKKQDLGADHPSVAAGLNNLAVLHQMQGELEPADRLLRAALEIWEKALGADHVDVAACLNSLGEVSQKRGDLDGAEGFYRRAIEIWTRAFGADHPDTAYGYHHLANLHQERGEWAQAEALYLRAQAIWEREFGPDHRLVGGNLSNLAPAVRAQGRLTEAAALFERTLAVLGKIMGSGHPDLAEIREQHADLQAEIGQP